MTRSVSWLISMVLMFSLSPPRLGGESVQVPFRLHQFRVEQRCPGGTADGIVT